MQLKGPPKLNDYLAPYPTAETPLQAAFRRDEEIETYVKTRDGTLARVGDQALRGRFTLSWDGLDYDTALRILFEVRSGEVELTPRTDIGGGALIDIDGDGIPDLILEEVRLPCRVIEDIPTSTPIGRRARQAAIAGLELTFETLQTYSEIPGFTAPAQFQFVSYGTASTPYTYVLGTGGTEVAVQWDAGGPVEVGADPTHDYSASGGQHVVTVVVLSRIMNDLAFGITDDWRDLNGNTISATDLSSPLVEGDQTDLSDVTTKTISSSPRSADDLRGALPAAAMPEVTERWNVDGDKNSIQYSAGDVRGGVKTRFSSNRLSSTSGDLALATGVQNTQSINVLGSGVSIGTTASPLQPGGAVGTATVAIDARSGNGTYVIDASATGFGTPRGQQNVNGQAPNIREFLGSWKTPGGGAGNILRSWRQCEALNSAPIDDMRGPCVPPTMQDLVLRREGSNARMINQWGWLGGATFRIGGAAYLEDATGTPIDQAAADSLRSAYDAGTLPSNTDISLINGENLFQTRVNGTLSLWDEDTFLWLVGLGPYHGSAGGAGGLVEHINALSVATVFASDDWKKVNATTLKMSISMRGDSKIRYDEGRTGEPLYRKEVQGTTATEIEAFQPGDWIRLEGTDTSGAPIDEQVRVASYDNTVRVSSNQPGDPEPFQVVAEAEITIDTGASSVYATTVPDVDTSASRTATLAWHHLTTGPPTNL